MIYLFSVVAIGWAVTFGLRALPFLLFAGRDRKLPRWMEHFGNVVSPVIIGGLVIYSYTGLEWRTAWPYLAGLLTVGLHLWKRNPLVSIVMGTVLYMVLVGCCGCTTTRSELEFDAQNPAFQITENGVLFGNESIQPDEIVDILDSFDIPKTRTIHIQLDPNVKNLSFARSVMGLLARGGYTRPVLVTKRHAESAATGRAKSPRKVVAPKAIRYKKANE